jgi:hypothetical protein
MNRKVIAGGVAAGVMGLGVAIASAGSASAVNGNEQGYLNLISAQGIVIYNANGAVQRGYQLCGMIEAGNGRIAAEQFYAFYPSESGSLHNAQMMVNDAANTLCPWVWGNGAPLPSVA